MLQVIAARMSRDAEALASLLTAIDQCLPTGAMLPPDMRAGILALPLPGAHPQIVVRSITRDMRREQCCASA